MPVTMKEISLGQKIYYALHGKPKNVGEAFQRVVKSAGGGRSGHLIEVTKSQGQTIRGAGLPENWKSVYTKGGITTRHYSNGVQLRYGDVDGFHIHPRFPNGVIAADFSGENVLAVMKKSGNVHSARSSATFIDSLTGKLDHFCQKLNGRPKNSSEQNFKDCVEAVFKTLA